MQVVLLQLLQVLSKTFLVLILTTLFNVAIAKKDIEVELNSMWQEMSRTITAGDIKGYRDTFHQDATLVLGDKHSSYHINKAFERWSSGFDKVKSGLHKVNVEFRFSNRIHDESTAYETGMYYYELVDERGDKTIYYVNLEALATKTHGKWQVMMEYQKSEGTVEQWNQLKTLK